MKRTPDLTDSRAFYTRQPGDGSLSSDFRTRLYALVNEFRQRTDEANSKAGDYMFDKRKQVKTEALAPTLKAITNLTGGEIARLRTRIAEAEALRRSAIAEPEPASEIAALRRDLRHQEIRRYLESLTVRDPNTNTVAPDIGARLKAIKADIESGSYELAWAALGALGEIVPKPVIQNYLAEDASRRYPGLDALTETLEDGLKEATQAAAQAWIGLKNTASDVVPSVEAFTGPEVAPVNFEGAAPRPVEAA